MQQIFAEVGRYTALAIETTALLIVAYGAVDAIAKGVRARPRIGVPTGRRKIVFVNLGAWLVLGLEFELAADVVRTAIEPTWADLGRLAAVATIRTFLNYFLEQDLQRLVGSGTTVPAERAARPVAVRP